MSMQNQDMEDPTAAASQDGERPAGDQTNFSGEHSLGDYYYTQHVTFKDISEHMTGPVISIIAHVILIALLFTFMVFQPAETKQDVQIEVKDVEMKEIDTPTEPPPPPEETSAMDESAVQIIDRPAVAATSQGVNVDMSDVKIDAASSLSINLPDVMSIRPDPNALKVPYGNRGSKEARAKLLKAYRADSRNEIAVEKALNWLKENQNEDGTWGTEKNARMRIPLTSLATLALLAHGELPSSQKYGQCIIKAIKKMVEWPETMGAYMGPGDNYSHPVAAYTLAEIYGVTRIPRVKVAMDKTIGVVINFINKNGSYAYYYDRNPNIQGGQRDQVTGKLKKGEHPEPGSDLSFAGWNYQALKSALAAGCDLPGLESAIDSSLKGLRMHCNAKEGGFALNPGGKSDIGMTSVGILCMGLLGDGDSKEARKSLEWLKKSYAKGLRTCSWKFDKTVHEEYNKAFTYAIYTWYYQTQMLFQASHGQGVLWDNWNTAFSKALIDEQNADGSWLTPAEKYGRGSLDPKKDNAEWLNNLDMNNEKDLMIYATVMCTLSLEVYYRYLPTYKLAKESVKKSNAKEDDLAF